MLIVQETHCIAEKEAIWMNEWGGKALYSHGTSAARGIAVFLDRSICNNVRNIYRDINGRLIIFDLEENGIVLTIVALYAPNQDDPSFLKEIQHVLKDRSEHKIVVGDFNVVLDVEVDRMNTYHNNNKVKEEIENLCDEYYLMDVWRVQHGDKREYSWFKKGEIQKASRIDFALVSAGLDQSIKIIEYISSIKTDHRAIYMVVDTKSFDRGNGFWKLNTSLLTEIEYLKAIEEEILTTISLIENKKPKVK